MKILVFSDSHGDRQTMVLAAEAHRPDAIFHLGDCWRDAAELEDAFPDPRLYQVPGNCVKGGYSAAVNRARETGADVLLCGHTHIPRYEDYGGLQLLNPGSAGYGHTYGLIATQRGCALCSVRTLD